MECTCESRNDTGEIIYCPLHLAAPDMSEAIQELLKAIDGNFECIGYGREMKLRKALAKVDNPSAL